MAINTYTLLKAAVASWLARTGDTDLGTAFDDHLALCEHEMYYGASEIPSLGIAGCEPLRIREMEDVSASFALTSATVAQPTGFLEVISAALNTDQGPIDIVTEGVIDAYGEQTLGGVKAMAISGTNFRFKDTPGGTETITLRYFKKLTTPTGGAGNAILTNAPGVYLNGCLKQAAIWTQDPESAKMYGALFASQVRSLNERRNRELWSATNTRLRIRGRTP